MISSRRGRGGTRNQRGVAVVKDCKLGDAIARSRGRRDSRFSITVTFYDDDNGRRSNSPSGNESGNKNVDSGSANDDDDDDSSCDDDAASLTSSVLAHIDTSEHDDIQMPTENEEHITHAKLRSSVETNATVPTISSSFTSHGSGMSSLSESLSASERQLTMVKQILKGVEISQHSCCSSGTTSDTSKKDWRSTSWTEAKGAKNAGSESSFSLFGEYSSSMTDVHHGKGTIRRPSSRGIRRDRSKLCVPSQPWSEDNHVDRLEVLVHKIRHLSESFSTENAALAIQEIACLSTSLQELSSELTRSSRKSKVDARSMSTGNIQSVQWSDKLQKESEEEGEEEDATPKVAHKVPFRDKVNSLKEKTASIELPLSPRSRLRRLRFLHTRSQIGVCPKTRLPHLPPVRPPPLQRRYSAGKMKNSPLQRQVKNSPIERRHASATAMTDHSKVEVLDVKSNKSDMDSDLSDAIPKYQPCSNRIKTENDTTEEYDNTELAQEPKNSEVYFQPVDAPGSLPCERKQNGSLLNKRKSRRSTKVLEDDNRKSVLSLFSYHDEMLMDSKKELDASDTVMATTESKYSKKNSKCTNNRKVEPRKTNTEVANTKHAHKSKKAQKRLSQELAQGSFVRTQSTDAPHRNCNFVQYPRSPLRRSTIHDIKALKAERMKCELELKKKGRRQTRRKSITATTKQQQNQEKHRKRRQNSWSWK